MSRSELRVRWLSGSPPDDRGVGITRSRLSRKFGGDLRGIESEFYWTNVRPRMDRRERLARGAISTPRMTVQLVRRARRRPASDDPS